MTAISKTMPAKSPPAKSAPKKSTPAHEPLTQARRNGFSESTHYGAVAVVNAAGELLYSVGDPSTVTFGRSALKPFQALPFFANDGVTKLGLTQPEAAVLCASHNGEDRHTKAVASILEKAGSNPGQLRCGCHVPLRFTWFDTQPPANAVWSALHHNCSGKHAGFIAAARLMGSDATNYLAPENQIQKAARQALALCAGMTSEALFAGTDGCSAPTFALPLQNIAFAFAKLAEERGSKDLSDAFGTGLKQIYAAMTEQPEMVSGEGRNDLAFTKAGRGNWVCKIGAEAVQCIGVRTSSHGTLGIAIKIADGNNRGLYPASIAVLERMGLLDDASCAQLATWRNPQLKNAAGIVVGDIISLI